MQHFRVARPTPRDLEADMVLFEYQLNSCLHPLKSDPK